MGQEESSFAVSAGPPRTLADRSLSAVAEYIKSGNANKIVVMTGAGISTAAGIPDFRSPKTGLYNNLARLNLPYAEAVFDISYFRSRPEPFYVLANELYPGKFYPTVSHAFIALLARKGLLQMLFTQNIDCLERRAGVPSEKIIEAHGSFATQRCIECKTEYPDDKMKEHVFGGKVPHCGEKGCGGLVKPDIVFFGEALPKSFDNNTYQACIADLVLVIGTSLTVYPFAGLPEMATEGKPRVLFNMERVGRMGSRSDDVVEIGSCDAGIRKLADELGWRDELEKLWRDVVGEKEAERQLASQDTLEAQLEDEVDKLAEGVGSVVIGDEAVDPKTSVPSGYVKNIAGLLDPQNNPKPKKDDEELKPEGSNTVEKKEPEESEETTQTETSAPTHASAGSEPPKPGAVEENIKDAKEHAKIAGSGDDETTKEKL